MPAFRKPEAKNAATTLMVMAVILGTLFFGVSLLASRIHPFPPIHETVISQLGRTVFGEGPFHTFLQFATAAILVLAANTAYADFPRLSSIIARDGFPAPPVRQPGRSPGVLQRRAVPGGAASVLLIAFSGQTTTLIPLYAVGVFTSFTLSQAGMVMHHRRRKEPGWKRNMVLNAVGSARHRPVYAHRRRHKVRRGRVAADRRRADDRVVALGHPPPLRPGHGQVEVTPEQVRPQAVNHTVVVLVGRVHKGVLKAIAYARSLRPQHLVALYVSFEDEDRQAIEAQWQAFGIDVPLEIVYSPYRELIQPIELFLDELDDRWDERHDHGR